MKDYKKILEGVVSIISTTEKSDIGFANICTYIGENCPELKESEDEKIRKELIRFHKSTIDINGIKGEDIIAWLEKQGKSNPYSGVSFEYDGHTWGMCARDYGVDILGDSLWTPDEHLVYLEELKKSVKNSRNKPISSGLHLYLAVVEFTNKTEKVLLQIDKPKSWTVLQKMLERVYTS